MIFFKLHTNVPYYWCFKTNWCPLACGLAADCFHAVTEYG